MMVQPRGDRASIERAMRINMRFTQGYCVALILFALLSYINDASFLFWDVCCILGMILTTGYVLVFPRTLRYG